MFNNIISKKMLPKYLSSDNDPLFQFYRWRANLRILEIEEIKTVPHVPMSHPFVERLIGTVRREYLDSLLFWNSHDLENKLNHFKEYYNNERAHSSLNGEVPTEKSSEIKRNAISIKKYDWKNHCGSLFSLPVAA